MQIKAFRGRRTVMSFRLCSRAPWTMSSSEAAIRDSIVPCEHVFGKGNCGGPLVVLRVSDESRPNRVVEHVGDRVEELRLTVDHPRREAGAEQVAGALVAVVEPPGVLAVQELDSGGEPRPRRVEHEMDVVAHQAVRVAGPLVVLDGLGEQAEIGEPVVVVAKDHRAVDSASGYVKIAVGELRTKNARHGLRG